MQKGQIILGDGQGEEYLLMLTLTFHTLAKHPFVDQCWRRQTPTQRGW